MIQMHAFERSFENNGKRVLAICMRHSHWTLCVCKQSEHEQAFRWMSAVGFFRNTCFVRCLVGMISRLPGFYMQS